MRRLYSAVENLGDLQRGVDAVEVGVRGEPRGCPGGREVGRGRRWGIPARQRPDGGAGGLGGVGGREGPAEEAGHAGTGEGGAEPEDETSARVAGGRGVVGGGRGRGAAGQVVQDEERRRPGDEGHERGDQVGRGGGRGGGGTRRADQAEHDDEREPRHERAAGEEPADDGDDRDHDRHARQQHLLVVDPERAGRELLERLGGQPDELVADGEHGRRRRAGEGRDEVPDAERHPDREQADRAGDRPGVARPGGGRRGVGRRVEVGGHAGPSWAEPAGFMPWAEAAGFMLWAESAGFTPPAGRGARRGPRRARPRRRSARPRRRRRG